MSQTIEERIVYRARGSGWEFSPKDFADFGGRSTIPARYSSHYYDLHKPAGSAIKESSFARLGLLKDIVAFKERFYYSSWARSDLARPGSFRLAPSTAQIPSLPKIAKQ
jgi:hypothetical protein